MEGFSKKSGVVGSEPCPWRRRECILKILSETD